MNNAIAVISLDFGQIYSSEWFTKILSYQKTASKCNIFGNCLMLFLGLLLCSFAIVILPVDEISKGLTGLNWFQIVQICIGCILSGRMISMRYKTLVRGSRLTPMHHAIAVSMLPIVACAVLIVIQLVYVYPCPFVLIVSSSCGLPPMIFTLCYLERNNSTKIRPYRRDLLINMAVSFVLMFSHELIGVLYTIARGNEWIQSAVALLLPILKFTVRSIFAWYFRGKVEGYATVLMTFEVEFFNTLYTSIFMQSSKSPMVLLGLMSIDVIENLWFLYQMHQFGKKLKQIDSRVRKTKKV